MRRRAVARGLVLAMAAASLPGCIAVVGGDKSQRVETPTGEALTKLEKRMDRIDERLPKQ